MMNQMKALKLELIEHNEVENELAKRSHFCQRVIQKYKTQIKILNEELQNNKTNVDGTNSIMSSGLNSYQPNNISKMNKIIKSQK